MDARLRAKTIALTIIIVLSAALQVRSAEKPDSVVEDNGYTFKPCQIILPASLFAVGTFGVYNGSFRKLNREVRRSMTHLRGNHYTHVDNYLWTAPVAAYLGLDYLGVKARHPIKERLAAGATAYIVMAAATRIAKSAFGEERPDRSDNHSFPSGHTANIFTASELVRIEYGTWPGLGAYTLATGVAFLRLYNDRHWLNDVIGGAGIGILSARVGYWMLPLYRRWFGWNTPESTTIVTVAPAYTPATRSLSLSLVCTF